MRGRVPSLVPGMVLTVSEVVTAPVERFTAAASRPAEPAGWLTTAANRAAGAGGLVVAWLNAPGGEWHG